jgi:hypothetical protein
VYDLKDGTLSMKPYVDVEGSGQGVTIVRSRAVGLGTIRGASHGELRELTVVNSGPSDAVALVVPAFAFSATRVTCRAAGPSGTAATAVRVEADGTGEDKVSLRSVTAYATGAPAYGVHSRGSFMEDLVAIATSDDAAYGVVLGPRMHTLVNVVVEANGANRAVGIRTEGSAPYLRDLRIRAESSATAIGLESEGGSPTVSAAFIRAMAPTGKEAIGVVHRAPSGPIDLEGLDVWAFGGPPRVCTTVRTPP